MSIKIDNDRYAKLLGKSMLLPFGYTEERLDGIMRGRMQESLFVYAYRID
jgi:hypothetical protein